jgi:hypothetical protein
MKIRPIVEDDEPLDDDEVLAALIFEDGSVAAAAERLGVRSDRLRRFVEAKPRLREGMVEIMDRGVDMAVGVLFQGLRAENWGTRFQAAKEILKSEHAARRGFAGKPNAVELKAPTGGTLQLRWLTDDEPKGQIIEGEAGEA